MPDARGRRAFRFVVGGGFLLGLVFAAVLNPLALTALAGFLTLSQAPEEADLVLVLGGDFFGSRVFTGADLGAHGYAKRVMISGPPYKDRPESDLAVEYLVKKGYRPEMFLSFPIQAKSTVEEALAVCPELKRMGARRVLLVTSDYHSRRANLALRLFCPGIRFRSIAAPDTQFEIHNWWRNPAYRQVFFSEWQKILATIFWKYPQFVLERLWRALGGVVGY